MADEEEKHEPAETGAMPFLDHLEELRRRLLKSLLALVLMTAIAYYFKDHLMAFIVEPLGDVKLHVTRVTGSFYAYLKVSLIGGGVGAAPIVFYQLWAFVSPGLTGESPRLSAGFCFDRAFFGRSGVLLLRGASIFIKVSHWLFRRSTQPDNHCR